MKPADGFLNARQAAAYVGYEPGSGPARTDKAIKAFYAWVARHRVTSHRRGRVLLFTRTDLDVAIGHSTDAHLARQNRLEQIEELARRDARGERLRHVS